MSDIYTTGGVEYVNCDVCRMPITKSAATLVDSEAHSYPAYVCSAECARITEHINAAFAEADKRRREKAISKRREVLQDILAVFPKGKYGTYVIPDDYDAQGSMLTAIRQALVLAQDPYTGTQY